MLSRTRSNSFAVNGVLTRAVPKGLPQVRFNHDPLERLKVGVLTEHVHPPERSVQHMINETPSATLAVLGTIPGNTKTADRRQY